MLRLQVDIPNELSLSHAVSCIDENHLLYGNFIGVQYVFASSLDARKLANSIAKLVQWFPALAGIYDKKSQSITGSTEPLFLDIKNDTCSYKEHSTFGTVQSNRRDFIFEPKRRDVLKGRAPLSTFTLTNFADDGCILGIAVSHVLTDAAGFHILLRRLAEFYSGNANEHTSIVSKLPAFSFGTDDSKTETSSKLVQHNLKRPMKIKGLLGGVLKNIIVGAMDKMATNNRVGLHFSADDIARLKQKVLDESGEDWISTNVALSAHFTKIMAQLMYGDKKKTRVQIGQLLDLRGRYFDKDRDKQNAFVGNAILIHTSKTEFAGGIQHTPRGELARWFKRNLSGIDTPYLQSRLDLIADCLRQGYSYVGLELSDPMIALNNQSKMPVYNLQFGAETPVRVIPQDVGDNIMFFPTNNGGIEVYIRDILNPKRQEKLLTEEWQIRLFDF